VLWTGCQSLSPYCQNFLSANLNICCLALGVALGLVQDNRARQTGAATFVPAERSIAAIPIAEPRQIVWMGGWSSSVTNGEGFGFKTNRFAVVEVR